MRKSFLLVVNPTAGLARQKLISQVITFLQQYGATVTTFTNGHARSPRSNEVQAGSYDAVIASGGDGTIRELAIALADSDVTIGLIPAGTGNVLANEIGLKRHAETVANVLLNGPVVRFQSGLANGSAFHLMAGAGFDGTVVQRLNLKTKRRLGKLAYAIPTLKTLAGKIPRLDVEVDGTEHHASWVIVTNAKHYGGSFMLAPNADARKRGLTAILIKARSRAELLRALLALSLGRLSHQAGVTVLPCTSVSVRSDTPVPAQVDGDPFGTTPLKIEAGGPPLKLIVPNAYADDAPAA